VIQQGSSTRFDGISAVNGHRAQAGTVSESLNPIRVEQRKVGGSSAFCLALVIAVNEMSTRACHAGSNTHP